MKESQTNPGCMVLNTLHLKYVIEIEKSGSISKAAERLFMGQPNMSKAVRELEESLGFAIFRRTSKGVVPTEKGQQLLRTARSILGQVEELEALAHTGFDERQVFTARLPHCCFSARALSAFAGKLDKDKGLLLSVREESAQRTLADIVAGVCSLGVIRYRASQEPYLLNVPRERELAFEPLWEAELSILLSKHHPLVKKSKLRVHDLVYYPEITFQDDMAAGMDKTPETSLYETGQPVRRIDVPDRLGQLELLSGISGAYTWSPPIPEDLKTLYSLVRRTCLDRKDQIKYALVYPANHDFDALDRLFTEEMMKAFPR